jgi:hypothetical protein
LQSLFIAFLSGLIKNWVAMTPILMKPLLIAAMRMTDTMVPSLAHIFMSLTAAAKLTAGSIATS